MISSREEGKDDTRIQSIIQGIGRFSRGCGLRGRWLLPRLLRKAVEQLACSIPSYELSYRDGLGHWRVADLADHMDIIGFLGFPDGFPKDVARLINPGDWVVDVGANIGLMSAELCNLVGSHGCVWAIEPIPRNALRLEQLRDANNLIQLQILRGALSNETGSASIQLPRGGESGWASFTKSWDMAGTLDVRTWRLDDLVDAIQPARRLALLKVDVEGFEPQVLEGARQTIVKLKPPVFCEFNDVLLRDAGSSSSQLLDVFGDLGYQPVPRRADVRKTLTGRVRDLLLMPIEVQTRWQRFGRWPSMPGT